MKHNSIKTIAAAWVATIVVSLTLSACEGRRATDMVPSGDTVEVTIDAPESSTDTIPTI